VASVAGDRLAAETVVPTGERFDPRVFRSLPPRGNRRSIEGGLPPRGPAGYRARARAEVEWSACLPRSSRLSEGAARDSRAISIARTARGGPAGPEEAEVGLTAPAREQAEVGGVAPAGGAAAASHEAGDGHGFRQLGLIVGRTSSPASVLNMGVLPLLTTAARAGNDGHTPTDGKPPTVAGSVLVSVQTRGAQTRPRSPGAPSVGTTRCVQPGRVRSDCGGTTFPSACPFDGPLRPAHFVSVPSRVRSSPRHKRVRGRETSRVPVSENSRRHLFMKGHDIASRADDHWRTLAHLAASNRKPARRWSLWWFRLGAMTFRSR
jgi:hypothetical protein